jgi:hypothetical protein
MTTGAIRALPLTLVLFTAFITGTAAAQSAHVPPGKANVFEYWTLERRANALPRDLVIDPRGLGYLRQRDGSLQPHGHDVPALAQTSAKPATSAAPVPNAADTSGPTIGNMNPAAGAVIPASYTFSAAVTDPSGVRSVTFKVQRAGSTIQSFSATSASDGTWRVSLQGFSDGDWTWWVEAKDGAPKGGNTSTSPQVAFKVGIGSGGSSGSDTVTSAHWTNGGYVLFASGRLYFEMPGNARRSRWVGYVCSGTVATDGVTARSVVLTAAHCVYDDANKAFARNVMFIPDQDGTTATGTDLNCSNDPIGCWVPSFGVVDVNWTTRKFPDNAAWDYAFYVVSDDAAAHKAGVNAASNVLDEAAGSLPLSFGPVYYDDPTASDYTTALGYSYNQDPKLMYCAQDMTTQGAVNWWLASCALSGGSSGGPWVQPISPAGFGNIISVNSWGYTSTPGMAGPKLVGTSASCVFESAKSGVLQNPAPADGDAGLPVTCP